MWAPVIILRNRAKRTDGIREENIYVYTYILPVVPEVSTVLAKDVG